MKDFNASTIGMQPGMKKKLLRIIVAAAVLLFLAAISTTCWYTVSDKQQGVVTTLGRITAVTDAGIHFKAPFGIQKVTLVNVNVQQKIEIGYKTGSDGSVTAVSDESKMITGDFNIVNIDFFVEYKVADPVKYLYASQAPESVLKSLVQSQIRTVIGSYGVDDILTTGKAEIQAMVKDIIIKELEQYDIGLMLIDVKIQDAEAPTPEVIEAFKSVETAKQDKETALNEAKAYENANIPKARAQEDQLIQNAEYLRQNRINEAKNQVVMFEAMYRQYNLNPQITRQRMYFEALEDVLPGVKIYVDTSGGGVNMLLPLESFANIQQQGGGE